MANFKPLNNYSLFVLDRLINQYQLKPPFLDLACGSGYVSRHLAKKGWEGKAVDYSAEAVKIARENLKKFKKVTVQKKSLFTLTGKFNSVLLFDVLEHIENDLATLRKINSLLNKGGSLIIAGPSNPKEWRWDDDFYGHFRRYSEQDLVNKLSKTGFQHIISYDYTYPFFWALRRIYTFFINKQKSLNKDKRTKESSYSYAWDIPIIGKLFNKTEPLWFPIYLFQYAFFRKRVLKGSSMIVLAKKK